ncbi:hypothetical protein AGABI1DRAFT_127110 [Agaricus bisporus var. burnettii JB137-S8]|uniref:DUF6533 domain-containing protein n=1 Tax=Agaricus bisporus var. burnettii (strain JB137-S8 / ATCC MYA-4627 / FGSC 10392) TaxID=597362 RepID=K5WZY5_AGABU|nr:uncharacterized protein AGABI1DRAFT_127110 [Agaricus bisporus var. burnettii JB137-S8]EKM81076.1 hypothetical protein AGABI1DRAFT_127110 [Agaricus bisporus var. burnettii JB137-S8]
MTWLTPYRDLWPLLRDTTGRLEVGNMHVVLQASCIGLTFNVWEFLVTLGDEVDLVWLCRPSSWTLRLVRGLFFFSRYAGLMVQSINIVVAENMSSYRSVPNVFCRRWISYQIIVIFLFLSVVNLILNLRIYAIYRRSRRMCTLLTVIFFSRLVLATPFAIVYTPRLAFDGMCGFRIPLPIMLAFLQIRGNGHAKLHTGANLYEANGLAE